MLEFEATSPPHAVPEHERALADALRSRSPDAWAQVFDAHFPHIYRYVLVRTSSEQTAKDLAATTFLEALKSAHTYTYRGRPVLAWLYTIARSVVARHYRNQSEEHAPPEATSETSADPAAGIDQLDLHAALRRLPHDLREVIALHYYAGLSLIEVARVLGKPERRIYSLQARAIAALRREMDARR